MPSSLATAFVLVYYIHAVFAGSTSSTTDADDEIPTFKDDDEARSSDYANYFSAYNDLYHQKIMLTDHNRMKAYHDAIMENKDLFTDKVVMDIGTGSSILAVWAAKAGAKRVYAIEYTNMANHAKNVVKANGVEDVVKVFQGAVEDVQLPLDEDWSLFCTDDDTKEECENDQHVVDIIISEWMGYFLLRESMLDSVIYARDKYLKKSTGLMFPSHATMLISPIASEKYRQEVEKDYSDAMTSWNEYLKRAQNDYGVDMSVLDDKFEKEQNDYYKRSGHWLQLEAGSVLAEPSIVKTLDLATCTLEDAKGVTKIPFSFDIVAAGRSSANNKKKGIKNVIKRFRRGKDKEEVSAFAGWFTVDFKSRTDETGKQYAPEVKNVHLSTGPEAGGECVVCRAYHVHIYYMI